VPHYAILRNLKASLEIQFLNPDITTNCWREIYTFIPHWGNRLW